MIELPVGGQWIQRNRGDMFGDLQGTFNIDYTKVLGKTRVTRMMKNIITSDLSNLTSYPSGFAVYQSLIYTIAGTGVAGSTVLVGGSQPNIPFTVMGVAGTPTGLDSNNSDIIVFNGNLYVTKATSGNNGLLYKFNGTSWSSATIVGNGPWMMCVYRNLLYITSNTTTGSKINSTADGVTIVAPTSVNALDLNNINEQITFIRPSSDRIWFGTNIITGNSNGYVYEWDGATTQSTTRHILESQGGLACVIKNETPNIIDTNGKLIQYQNGSFVEIARLPLEDKLLLDTTSTSNNRFIHPNGICLLNGKIVCLINNILADTTSTNEFCPSGIWEYDDVIYNPYTGSSQGAGFYHKYSLSYSPVGTNTITDYGQNRIFGVGAIAEVRLPTNFSASSNGTLIAGASVYLDATNTTSGIFINDTLQNITGSNLSTLGGGYIVTTKQYAIDEKGNSSIQNTWQNIYTLYQKLLTSTSQIEVKYRTVSNIPLEISITWTSSTTFTTTTSPMGLEGYEVEGIQGTGSGFCSHIVRIDQATIGATTTYTVTVDEAFTGVSGTAKVRIQNWKRISSMGQNAATYDQAGIGDLSNWVQFKIFMLFSNKDELERLLIVNQNTLPTH